MKFERAGGNGNGIADWLAGLIDLYDRLLGRAPRRRPALAYARAVVRPRRRTAPQTRQRFR